MWARYILTILIVANLTTASGERARAEQPGPTDCAACHDGRDESAPSQLPQSVHGDLDCTDCHEGISLPGPADIGAAHPHGSDIEPVDCGACHDDAAEAYTHHGRLEIGKDPDLPRCWSCHGVHDIRPGSDPRSRVHPLNLPQTCDRCHEDLNLVKKHFGLRDAPIRLFESSVHGRGLVNGRPEAATCTDCHGTPDEEGRRTAHHIRSGGDPQSPIYRLNIPDTCGRCHKDITQAYREGIHGQYVERGSMDAPVCTTCHGEHGIVSPRDPRSPVSPARIAEQTCTPCHESLVLNEKYGRGDHPISYIDSYHGLKSKAGDPAVANCASCHGAHRILPSSDPRSSIHPDNLQNTCGACHPNITAELAQTPIHETDGVPGSFWPEFFRKLYIVLIVVTIGVMALHNGADWWRALRHRMSGPVVERLSTHETVQHWALMISFIVLVVTGFALRFSEAGWVKLLFGHDRGFVIRGVVHRVAAVVLMIASVWHLLYLFTERGRRWFRDIMVSSSDLSHVRENVLYFAGRRPHGPRFGRFSYMEKAEYWALVWGTVIMTVTGLALWFDNFLVECCRTPRVVLDVARVIHYYEAWLATLAILVWHVYGTVFKPGVYPMNPAWIAGRMPRDMYLEEHPGDPPPEFASSGNESQGRGATDDAANATSLPEDEPPDREE